jgi:predicted Zn-dependent protease
MPTTKSREQSKRSSTSGEFASRYTRDDAGFYVRNTKPSEATLNEKRISENVRDLLRDITATGRDRDREDQ